MNKNITEKQTEPPQHKIYVVHPQCRGYVHRTAFIFNTLQTHSYDMCTQLQIFSTTQSCALSYRTFLLKPYKYLCTLSCKGCPRTQLGINLKNPKIGLSLFASNYHHTKPFEKLFSPLHKCLFIQVHYYNTMGLNHGHPKTINHGLFTKRGASTQPQNP